MKNCRKCGVGLVEGENWRPSYAATQNYLCVECVSVYNRQYRQDHVEEIAASAQVYRDGHRAELAEKSRQYYATHREERKVYNQSRRDEDREYSRQYRLDHLEERREQSRQWKRDNPKRNCAYEQRRQARKANATIGEVDIAVIYERDKVCIYCGSDKDLTVDHLVPLARGGPHQQDNLAVACRSCNSRKGTKTYEEFICLRAL